MLILLSTCMPFLLKGNRWFPHHSKWSASSSVTIWTWLIKVDASFVSVNLKVLHWLFWIILHTVICLVVDKWYLSYPKMSTKHLLFIQGPVHRKVLLSSTITHFIHFRLSPMSDRVFHRTWHVVVKLELPQSCIWTIFVKYLSQPCVVLN